MAQILLKLCQGLLTDETRRKASYNHGSKVLYSLVRAISKAQSCPLLLVGLGQNLEKASRIVAMEIFFLKCLRSGWDMTRTFVWAPYGQEMGSWALWSPTGHSPGAFLQSRPPPLSAVMSYGTEISKVSNVSPNMFGRPSCVPGSCVQSFSPLTVRVSL